ncbi:hypothetical protein EDB92DRAFT_1932038 [Lactarius akahatsu]|uniref:M-phase inducer phosphatase n=1 Tax=Lactarius akahatsu TaxID=416441 RepID=A0AAD4QIA4_9AGAM|nr:hypothetical protein EDB92DRAFT_1932038 [Lactarius akahatsu]
MQAFFNPPPANLHSYLRVSDQQRTRVEKPSSSGLELSFASTVSLQSLPGSTKGSTKHLEDMTKSDVVPMDISPEPSRFTHQIGGTSLDKARHPHASTSFARLFGRDLSNESPLNPYIASSPEPPAAHGHTQSIGLSLQSERKLESARLQSARNSSGVHEHAPSSPDAMDVDTSFTEALTFPPKPDSSPSAPFTAAPAVSSFQNIFYDPSSPGCARDDLYESKKRRSASPEGTPEPAHGRRRAGTVSVFGSSSPAVDSSPSVLKLERMANLVKKPMLSGLGIPSHDNAKHLRKPIMSALVPPSDVALLAPPPPRGSSQGEERMSAKQEHGTALPPPRRAFSAMLPEHRLGARPSGESPSERNEECSPALAYAQRHKVRTIRRRDGTDDFRSLTGATAMVVRDQESPRARMVPQWGVGLGGFGDNEAFGKILPCHRVREDGLMRINCKTLNDVLDGVFKSRIVSYQVIDCRFDYEYIGGHVPGALNINTTTQLEEYFLGANANKPVPSVSGEGGPKHILIFHCEFSAKRAPTFAKHLRSKDRSVNNHSYPRVHFPEVYILEGGYCQYFKESGARCEPSGYVRMDDPYHAASRKEDLDQFRKAKFGRTKSYAYGDAMGITALKTSKRNPGAVQPLFAATSVAHSHREINDNGLRAVPEDPYILPSEDEETDIGDSPCPPPSKNPGIKAKKLGLGGTRGPLMRAETYGPSRFESAR